MGKKEEVSSSYLETVRAKTREYQVPPSRKAIIIGSARGNINEAIAAELAVEGFEVIVPSMNELDVTEPHQMRDFFRWNRDVDTLILGQAYNHLDWIEDQPVSDIKVQVDSILTGSIMATKMFVQATLDRPVLKHLVFIGSMAYRSVLNASAPYCAAKAGLAHFARCAGWELTPKGYRVFCVHPSNTKGTPMTKATIEGIMQYRKISQEDAEEYWGAVNLMPDWLNRWNISDVVTWLISGELGPQFLTGTNIELSGGQR